MFLPVRDDDDNLALGDCAKFMRSAEGASLFRIWSPPDLQDFMHSHDRNRIALVYPASLWEV